MRHSASFFPTVSALTEAHRSSHFALRFLWRNPPSRSASFGNGTKGVRGINLVSRYLAALERAYTILTSATHPFCLPAPKTDAENLTEAYIWPTQSPYTDTDLDDVPYICLPNRTSEPMLQGALHRAEVEAAHETVHVFLLSLHQDRTLMVKRKWRWFHEATAVFVEGEVFAGNLDSLRFGRQI